MKFPAALVLLALFSGTDAILRFSAEQDPLGPGQPEPSKAAACAECKKHEPYIKSNGDDCFCTATDIMGTFENDATKTINTRSKYGFTGAVNTGDERLAQGWMWHCRK